MFDVFYSGPKPELFAFESPAENLSQADQLSRTKYFWFINGHNDYSQFDFSYKPVPWEADHTHVWPSQWQQNGGTLLVPTGTKGHAWHWHDQPITRTSSVPIYYMDFMNPESAAQLSMLQEKWGNVKKIRYVDNHLDVLKRIISMATTEYIWVTASICNYETFDFTWHPSQWQAEMIHCFSWSTHERNRRGNTFYIHVESFRKQMYELELLDWFNVIHYNDEQCVYNFNCPTVYYVGDNLLEVVKKHDFKWPYTKFINHKNTSTTLFKDEICLWTEKDRQIVPFTSDNSSCLIPKDVKRYLDNQLYDYPYINNFDVVVARSPTLDVKFISNGEPDANRWYKHLLDHCRGINVQRIMNINGRMAAYKAAAESSQTDWFFAVFAKLEVDPGFNWDWQPDYWQEPKHYIFHARNPVNGLVYGHQAMIAYNKRLVLETIESGLDFTLSKAHEVVPLLSGTAHFNQDPWTTWRTAFREVLKLKHFNTVSPNVESIFRIKKWTTQAQGAHSEWCLQGAADAIEYYDKVNGDYAAIMLSFEWDWLRTYACSKNYKF
jgi:hypothetical protein